MSVFFSNVFNDPSSPWYYVIGVLFLLLIFAALAVYMIFTNKKKKDGSTDNLNTDEKPTEDRAIVQSNDTEANDKESISEDKKISETNENK